MDEMFYYAFRRLADLVSKGKDNDLAARQHEHLRAIEQAYELLNKKCEQLRKDYDRLQNRYDKLRNSTKQ